MAVSTWEVSDLIAQLDPDPWRRENSFSADMLNCHDVLFDVARSREEKAVALSAWLAENQPCLFGQMEAKQHRLAICLLTDNDLERSDQHLRARIQRERTNWKRQALDGGSHGFLIVAVSEHIAEARPGVVLHRLAKRLCECYLGASDSDTSHLDDVILEIRQAGSTVYRNWRVGVNYFSAQADGRWWQDHRLPGGMAFSMNSVGHMARARAEQSLQRNPKLAAECASIPREKLAYFALPTAMKTIGPPSEGSGRATWLVQRGGFPEDREPPTFEQRQRYFADLASFSENRYRGLYHTDHTIPSPYFDEGLWRREDLIERDDLYFTYLHSLSDPDYESMGLGIELESAKVGEPPTRFDSESKQ